MQFNHPNGLSTPNLLDIRTEILSIVIFAVVHLQAVLQT
jgi:hypothetical protein